MTRSTRIDVIGMARWAHGMPRRRSKRKSSSRVAQFAPGVHSLHSGCKGCVEQPIGVSETSVTKDEGDEGLALRPARARSHTVHEYSLVLSILERIGKEAEARHAREVVRVRIKVGEIAGVEPELLRYAFELAREGTICAKTELDIEVVPGEWICTGCGAPIERGTALQCNACGQPARLRAGGDITLDTMELEVDDV